jgi:hypothetical protein
VDGENGRRSLSRGESGGKKAGGSGGPSSKRFPKHLDFSLFLVPRQYIARSRPTNHEE